MKKLLISLFTLLCLGSVGGNVSAAEPVAKMLNFEKVEQLPKDSLVAIPVYLNTQGKELNSLQLKVDVVGEIKDLSVSIGSKIPVQEIAKEVKGNSIFVSLTSLELGKSWNTPTDTELVTVSFSHKGDGEVKLSFDPKETIAASVDSDKNVLTIGEAITVKIGTVVPATVSTQVTKEATPSVTQAATAEPSNTKTAPNNNLLIGLIVISFVAALITLVYILKSQKKDKPLEPKLPLN